LIFDLHKGYKKKGWGSYPSQKVFEGLYFFFFSAFFAPAFLVAIPFTSFLP